MTGDSTTTPKGSTNARSATRSSSVKHYTKDELELENFELVDQVLELLNTHELWDTDGTYTFTNGERWAEFKPKGDEDE